MLNRKNIKKKENTVLLKHINYGRLNLFDKSFGTLSMIELNTFKNKNNDFHLNRRTNMKHKKYDQISKCESLITV